MINGIGVVGWGVGGIEAEAGMLGQPVYFLTPDVVGVNLKGKLREGVTATDLVLTVTEMLRKAKVVGKFVEFFGEGADVARRARPRHHRQHGARVRRDHGLLPGRRQDHRVLPRHRPHRRRDRRVRGLLQGAGHVRHPEEGRDRLHARRSSSTWRRVLPVARRPEAPAGPHRAGQGEERRSPSSSRSRSAENGFAKKPEDLAKPLQDQRRHRRRERRRADRRDHLVHQHLQPGRAARRRPAGQEGGRARPDGQAAHQDLARAGLARGHRVPDASAGLLPYLEKLGFYVAGYGCTTCIGNAGPLAAADRGSDRQERPGLRARCSRATATSRRASTRTSAPTSSPRRRWSSPTPSPARC